MACCRRTRPSAASSATAGGARRVLRRLALVTSVGAGVASLVKRRRARDAAEQRPTQAPEWPPLVVGAATAATAAGAAGDPAPVAFAANGHAPVALEGAATPEALAPWVDPVDGQCPLTHPVKGNASSRIYHVPGSRFYDATIPERCYRDAEAAEADGKRAPKR